MISRETIRFLKSATARDLRERFRSESGSPPPDPLELIEKLRKIVPADPARAVVEQILLERRAREKFPDPTPLLFEREALEQASSCEMAKHHARSIPEGARVVDLGCGLGGDSLAFAEHGHPLVAIDRDDARAALAAHNLACRTARATVVVGCAGRLPARGDVLFVDPDRRPGARRTISLHDGSPAWSDLRSLADRFDSLLVKAAPAIPDEEIPPEAAIEFLSEDRTCKEAFLRLGAGARPGSRFAVLVGTGLTREIVPGPPAETSESGSFLLDPDPALRRAGGVDALAREIGARRTAPGSTYLLCDEPVDSPWVRSYRILDQFPYRERDLRLRLRREPPRELVVKQRGVGLPEARIRKGLPLAREGPALTLVLFPRGRTRIVCLCEEA